MSKATVGERQLQQAQGLLEEALGVLSVRRQWTRRAWARDARSRPVEVTSERACRWCLGGAILLAEARLHGTRIVTCKPEAVAGVRLLGPPRRLIVAFALLEGACLPWAIPLLERCPAEAISALVGDGETVLLSVFAPVVNDAPSLRHRDIVRVLELAIEHAQDERRRRAGRGRKEKP